MDLILSLIDGGAPRPDLAAREETKYVFRDHDVAALRDVLLRSCRPISYAGPVSTVHSLYFDDEQLSACRANLDGIGIRHKTRLRWYDRPAPDGELYFETKWRRHRVVGKRRLPISVNSSTGA